VRNIGWPITRTLLCRISITEMAQTKPQLSCLSTHNNDLKLTSKLQWISQNDIRSTSLLYITILCTKGIISVQMVRLISSNRQHLEHHPPSSLPRQWQRRFQFFLFSLYSKYSRDKFSVLIIPLCQCPFSDAIKKQ